MGDKILPVVFQKEAFTLCKVPVPKGYPQSQTHCGVAECGSRILMTTSPYPVVKYNSFTSYIKAITNKLRRLFLFELPTRAECFENPCLYVGDGDGQIPTEFSLILERPLMECPENYYGLPSYNSDPDLFVEGNKVNILNRVVYRMSEVGGQLHYNIRLHLISGIMEGEKFRFYNNDVIEETCDRLLISPCLTRFKDNYVLFELETNAYNDGLSFDGLFCKKGNTLSEVAGGTTWDPISVNLGDWLPWHMSVFKSDDDLYAIVSCVKRGEGHRCWQMLAKFNSDLSGLLLYDKPLTDLHSYRSSAVVKDGVFVLYNSTVRESFLGGKSVDGREIVMASMPFGLMLNKLSGL